MKNYPSLFILKNTLMKKVFITLSISILVLGIQAQTTFGLRGGANLSKLSYDNDSENYFGEAENLKPKIGFHFGPTYDSEISEKFSIESALLISTKGFKWVEENENYEFTYKENPMYVELQIAAKGTFQIKDSLDFIALAGPYLGYGIGGKWSEYEKSNGEVDEDSGKLNWGDGLEDHYKPLDYGLVIGAGVEYERWQLLLTYTHGMTNVIPDGLVGEGNSLSDSPNTTISHSKSNDEVISYNIKNRVIGVSLGYRFNNE